MKQLLTETKLAKEFYEARPISKEEAEEIAVNVEKKIFDLMRKAYTEARFKSTYKVSKEDIKKMIIADKGLGALNKYTYNEKIKDIK